MDELYDLSNDQMRMMREYLDHLSGNNRGDMPEGVRGGNGAQERVDVFREIMDMKGISTGNLRFDTQKAWEKVSARIRPDDH